MRQSMSKHNGGYKKSAKNAIHSEFTATPPPEKSIAANGQANKNIRSTNKKLTHCRHPTFDANVKKCQFVPNNNLTLLKSILRRSAQNTTTDRENTYNKIMDSSLYKKLLLELQNTKKNYNKEISSLKDEIKELDELIVLEKQALLGLIHKRNKMEADVNRATNQLIELQQGNYERYWDVAARMNNEDDQYQELLELENQMGSVSRGLPKADLEKLITKFETRKTRNTTNPQEVTESCCICCQNLCENQAVCCLPCGHAHHSECIREWLGINKVCPLCRKQVLA